MRSADDLHQRLLSDAEDTPPVKHAASMPMKLQSRAPPPAIVVNPFLPLSSRRKSNSRQPSPGDWSASTPLERRRTRLAHRARVLFSPVSGAAGETLTFPHNMLCANCSSGLRPEEARWGTGLCDRCWETAAKVCLVCKKNLQLKQLRWGSGLCRDCFNQAQKDCVICGIGLKDDQLKWQTGMCDKCYDNCQKTCIFCSVRLDPQQVKWRTGLCDPCYDCRSDTCFRCSELLDRNKLGFRTGGLCQKCYDECEKQCRDCGSHIALGSLHWSTSLCDSCYDHLDKVCRGCRQWLDPSHRISGICEICREQYTKSCEKCRQLCLPNHRHWDTGLCDKCYKECSKVCAKCGNKIPFGQLKWGSGLCDECYGRCEKTCRVCTTRLEFFQLHWGTRMCDTCFDKCERSCRQCNKKLELGELYWGTGLCNSCFDENGQGPVEKMGLKAGVKAALWAQLVFYMAPGLLQPSLFLKLQAAMPPEYAAESYSAVLATASVAAMVAPVPLGLWAERRGEREVYAGVCLMGALAAVLLALPPCLPIFAIGWALLTFPPSLRGVRATYFAKNVPPQELSRAGQLASSSGLVGGFLGPIASAVFCQAYGEPSSDSEQHLDGFVVGSIFASVALLCFALGLFRSFEEKAPSSRLNAHQKDKRLFEERCERCQSILTAREKEYRTCLCDHCFDNYAGDKISFGIYSKQLLIIFCIIAAMLEFSMNAGVIAAFQPIVVEHFQWGNDRIAFVNVLGTGLSVAVSLLMAHLRLPEREQAAGAAALYLLGVTLFTAPPLQDWRLVLGMMLGIKAQILFMAPFTAVFSNLIGGARVTNFLTTMLCLAPAIGAALGTVVAPVFIKAAGTPFFFVSAFPALLAVCAMVAGWTRVKTSQSWSRELSSPESC